MKSNPLKVRNILWTYNTLMKNSGLVKFGVVIKIEELPSSCKSVVLLESELFSMANVSKESFNLKLLYRKTRFQM